MTLSSLRLLAAAALVAASTLYLPPARAASSQVTLLNAARDAGPLSISLDRPDWTYESGDRATVRVRFDVSPYPAEGIPIRYRLGPDMLEGPERTAVVPKAGLSLPIPAQAQPGFVRAIVSATVGGKPVQATATAAFSPLDIRPLQAEPADFDAFWAAQREQLAKVDPQWTVTPAPDLSTAEVDVSYLHYQNVGQGGRPTRIYGVLSVPRAEGRYPAVLQVPGAGVRGYKGSADLAAKGVITLQIGIHGIPVNLPDELYEQLRFGALESYNRYNLDNRETYYYRRVYLGALRGLDFLVRHGKWDGRNLVTQGGSQGGQLAIVTAALDPRVTATVASYPAYADVTGYLGGRAGGWPGLFRKDDAGNVQDQPVAPKIATTGYYDTVNFAKRLRAPVLFYAGYNDMVTPPTSTFAVYNVIPAPREIVIEPEQVHLTSPAHQATQQAWILRQAKGR
ncbi:prolyl oligopeptidase family serine peptidase [Massilia dura]|uniref:Prolyl oligopeptidase family serine peptidase n=1 Tax=Pseudoduganella dura TaxID=321982 RepID=A0A6I3XPF5_9BURK|nr:acetylxylan esterase [Pseudoduganella dura]MUI16343.1 prolyl oligopeptidase family serine peptidase [Pseudoduganella dura]GGY00608.1 cephalosporin deacetylase [Pseudoduganella dura]